MTHPEPREAPTGRVFETPAVVAADPSLNTTDLLMHRVRTTPDAPLFALPSGSGWKDVTAREFADHVVAIAKGFVAAGVQPGDRIAFMAKTSYDWTLIDFALWFAGAVMVPVYETSSTKQIDWMLRDSGAKGLIAETAEYDERVDETEAASSLQRRWKLYEGAIAGLERAGASIDDAEIERRRTIANEDDVATLIYTSGSTGRPKGCVLTHKNFVELSRNVVGTGPLGDVIHEGASTVLFITLAHVFARFISVLCIYGGVKVGHQHDTKRLTEALGSFHPTFLLAVPRVFEKVYNSAEQKAEASGRGVIFRRAANIAVRYSMSLDAGRTPLLLKLQYRLYDRLVYSKLREVMGGRVRHAVSGSAPLGKRLGHFYRAIGIIVLEGYGLTESTAPISVNLPSKSKIGTVGPALPGVAIKLAENGEILAKGINIFREYWKNPEATAAAFDGDWFRTGDLGSIDDDGYLTITGRAKEIIVTSGGKNVSPAALEDPIRANPLVSQVVVVGDQRPFIAALVTLDAEMLPSWLANAGENPSMTVAEAARNPKVRAEIQSAVDSANEYVSRAESIRKFVILPEDFSVERGTLTPKMSIVRGQVLAQYEQVIEGEVYGAAAPPTQNLSVG